MQYKSLVVRLILKVNGAASSLMVLWKQTHWNMLAHRTTINATIFSQGFIRSFVSMFFSYYGMTYNLHLFCIDSAESKNCAF